MKKATSFAMVLLALAACGRVQNHGAAGGADFSIAPGPKAVVLGAAFGDPIGSISAIDIADPSLVRTGLTTTDGNDSVIRSFGGRLYVINRFGTDTIQVIDPATFGVVANYSVGAGSNPQDIAVVSDEKAYISRLDAQNDSGNADDLLIVNPLTGARIGSIDLTPHTADDGDRLARAAQMVLVEGRLYVCLQDLPAGFGQATTNGKVVVIDARTDEVVDADPSQSGVQAIALAGRNPSDIAFSAEIGKLVVADTGGLYYDGNTGDFVYDTADPWGGIETIDLATLASDGIVIDDAAFGSYVNEVRLASAELGYTIVGSATVASFDPLAREVLSRDLYASPFRWLPDIALDESGRLWIAERDVSNPGIVIVHPEDGSVAAGPIGVGAPPVSIAFVEVP